METPQPRIVGWILQKVHPCDQCGEPAVVIVDVDGYISELCDECRPEGANDVIADTFATAVEREVARSAAEKVPIDWIGGIGPD